ncbi:MAG TPA: ATP synthase F1 subunit epsilon [Hyphomicrobiaceae bacterium]|nr:ATP synthase F1 subunit epsilon [Hyphomicrobiaceae bacterium]
MAGTFKFELVTPERMLIPARTDDGKQETPPAEATQVVVPGMDGQFTVLPGHAPTITTLRPGVLDIRLASGQRRVFVRGGFAEVGPDRLTILAQHLIDLDNATPGVLADELKAQEGLLSAARNDDERSMARDAIDQLRSLGAA